MIYMEKKKLEKIKAERRKIEAGKKYGTNSPKEVKENFPEPVSGQSRDKAADGLALTGKTLENYEKMINLTDATEKEKAHFLKTGKILDSLKEKYKTEKQRLSIIKIQRSS